LPMHVVDTAGLRATEDEVERHGISRAKGEIRGADVVLAMVDDRESGESASEEIFSEVDEVPARIVLRNKIDLSGSAPGVSQGRRGPEIRMSAKTGAGLHELKDTLTACVGYNQAGEGAFTARRRHLQALATAQDHARAALAQLKGPRAGELVAEDLRCMQQCLGEITGVFTSDDLLERIFSSFCIGK